MKIISFSIILLLTSIFISGCKKEDSDNFKKIVSKTQSANDYLKNKTEETKKYIEKHK